MREAFSNKCLNIVCKYNNYTEIQRTKMKYGFEVLYTIVTKTLGILLISLFLKTLLQTIVLMAFYSTLRLFGHGIHAKKSSHCWVSSILCYGIFPLLIKHYVINKYIILIMWFIAFFISLLWAPADTPKKPIINKKKRIIDKTITCAATIILIITVFISSNNLINNSIFFAYIMHAISINPLTYKLFNIPFNNYKNFNQG